MQEETICSFGRPEKLKRAKYPSLAIKTVDYRQSTVI